MESKETKWIPSLGSSKKTSKFGVIIKYYLNMMGVSEGSAEGYDRNFDLFMTRRDISCQIFWTEGNCMFCRGEIRNRVLITVLGGKYFQIIYFLCRSLTRGEAC